MAKKRSFFEKLTGASWSPEEEQEKKSKSPASSKKATPKKTEKKATTNKNKDLNMKKSKIVEEDKYDEEEISTESSSEKISDSSELPESEGQLTVDVYQTPNEVVIKSTIAGVKPNDIDITMNNDMITIKGTRQKDEDIPEEDYYYQECYWGPFSRSIILPVDVEVDNAKASMKNGILSIRLPKVEKVKTKKIEIKAE